MNTQTLIDNLKKIDFESVRWKPVFYSRTKTKDGVELAFQACNMQNGDIADIVRNLTETLLKKQLADRLVQAYTPYLSKEFIGALPEGDELVGDSIKSVLADIRHCQEVSLENLSGIVGYGFFGLYEEREVLFLTRTNPFLKKPFVYTSQQEKAVKNEKPILSFSKDTGFLYLDHTCYFINPNTEQDFGIESRENVICDKKMQVIAEKAIVNNYDQLEGVALKRKNVKKFLDFDQEVLEHIVKLPIPERAEFLGRYGILIDSQGLMDTDDKDQCELVIDLLCGRSCLDVFGRLSTGSNITPR